MLCLRKGQKSVHRSCEKSTNRCMTDVRKYRKMPHVKESESHPGSTAGIRSPSKFNHFWRVTCAHAYQLGEVI